MPRTAACLPGVNEVWQTVRRLSLGALSSTFLQGGRLAGFKDWENPEHAPGLLSLTRGLSLLGVAV